MSRTRLWLLIAAAALALFVVAGVATYLAVFAAAKQDTSAGRPAAAFVTPSPSPAAVVFSEETACAALIPVLGDGAKTVTAVLTKPDSADWDKLDTVLADLRGVAVGVPASMQADVDEQIRSMQLVSDIHHGRIGQQEVDLSHFRDSGVHLAETCRKYATG